MIEPLEERSGKPVVTGDSASLWKRLRLLQDRRPLPGAGRLLRVA